MTRRFWMTNDMPSVAMKQTVGWAPKRMKGPISVEYIASATNPPARAAAIAAAIAFPVLWCTKYAAYAPTVRISPCDMLATFVTAYSRVNATADSARMDAVTTANQRLQRATRTG